ncbi:MAG TPA: hypothetical protein VIV65_10190 [Gemmatimonadaceae bacterium]
MTRFWRAGSFRFAAIGAFALIVTAADRESTRSAVPGMTFRLRLTLRDVPSSGRTRTFTLLGRGAFGAGHGRVDIDSAEGPIRKGDIFIIVDSLNTLWAQPSTLRVRKLNSPLINPLEGISEKLSGSAGLPSDLKVDMDTVSLDESVNGMPTRHFRITADATYPISTRQIHQKVVVEQWLAKSDVPFANPFSARIRGLPEAPLVSGQYRSFINTLAAANRVFGEAVTVKALISTSYNYGGGMGEDHYQTVELLDLKQTNVDESLFTLPDIFRKKPAP